MAGIILLGLARGEDGRLNAQSLYSDAKITETPRIPDAQKTTGSFPIRDPTETGGLAKPQQQPPVPPQPYHPINHIVFDSNLGAVANIGDFSISFTQSSSTATMKGLYSHEFGNISLYFGW